MLWFRNLVKSDSQIDTILYKYYQIDGFTLYKLYLTPLIILSSITVTNLSYPITHSNRMNTLLSMILKPPGRPFLFVAHFYKSILN